jgi:protein TonB
MSLAAKSPGRRGATIHSLRRPGPTPTAARPPPRLSRWQGPVALLASLALHAGAIWGLHRGSNSARPTPHSDVIAMEIAHPSPPPKLTEPPPLPKRDLHRAIPKVPSAARPPIKPPVAAPPPPNQKVAKNSEPPPPIHIGVSLESTVSSGSVAVPVGNTLYGQAPTVAPHPAEVKPYWAEKYVPPFQVAELPVIEVEVKVSPYPPEARKAGIEGQVIALLTIDDQGRVARVRKLSGPGHGLDEAAVAALRKFRFKPARLNGQAVATEIRYVYSFEIE